MGQIILVRHGQANSGALTEEDYDRLSDLGAQQATHLGNWMRSENIRADVVLRGSLRRHIATADNMGAIGPDPVEDSRLNEMDYLTLGRALEDAHGVPQPGPDGFMDHFIEVLLAWKNAQIKGQETYDSFETRIAGVLDEASQQGRTVVCVTSGGVIAMMIRHLLRLDIPAMARIALPIWNTSMHTIAVTDKGSVLTSYNEIPHLGTRLSDLRTHY